MMAWEKPHEVLVAIPQAEPSTLREVVKVLEPCKVPIMTRPNVRDILNGYKFSLPERLPSLVRMWWLSYSLCRKQPADGALWEQCLEAVRCMREACNNGRERRRLPRDRGARR